MMILKFSMVCVLIKYLISIQVYAIRLINFDILNYCNKSVVLLDFEGIPSYNFRFLHDPERLVLDLPYVFHTCVFKQFPINFSNKYLIQNIYIDDSIDKKNVRFVFDLTYMSYIDDIFLEKSDGFYTVLLIITRNLSVSFLCPLKTNKDSLIKSFMKLLVLKKSKVPCIRYMDEKNLLNNNNSNVDSYQLKMFSYPIIVAIDAGHGGYDPGARGYSGLYEKDITIAIAKKIKKILDKDPIFAPVMIRDGDYFISVFERCELARSKGANILLSIHADAVSKNSRNTARGASVWVLSNYRANIEVTHWLQNSNKWSKLFGGLSDVLVNSINSDTYFNRTVLDLEFCYSQRVGYELALNILRELKNISILHKSVPEYSNFGILRSLDIPSVLIETGFMTHKNEEKLLANDYYQEKVAYAVYKGLRSYFLGYVSFLEKKSNFRLRFDVKNSNKFLYKKFRCECM